MFLLTGCFDKVELEDRGIVMSIGIDKSDIDGENFKISLSFPEIAQQNSSGSIKTSSGKSISSVINQIDSNTSKNLYFGHTKVVILGYEIMKDATIMKEVLDFLERNREISRKIIILGTLGQAIEIMEVLPKDNEMLGMYISDFYKNNTNPSFTYKLDLDEIIQNLLTTGDTIIPNIELDKEEVKFDGLSLIKGYEFISYMNFELTEMLIHIMDKLSLGELCVPFEDGFIPLDILSKSIKTSISEQNNELVINFDISINVSILEYILGENILIDSEKYKIVQYQAEKFLQEGILKSIDFLKLNDVDILGLKELVRKENFDLYNKYNLENINIFDTIKIEVNTDVNVQSAGKIK